MQQLLELDAKLGALLPDATGWTSPDVLLDLAARGTRVVRAWILENCRDRGGGSYEYLQRDAEGAVVAAFLLRLDDCTATAYLDNAQSVCLVATFSAY